MPPPCILLHLSLSPTNVTGCVCCRPEKWLVISPREKQGLGQDMGLEKPEARTVDLIGAQCGGQTSHSE